MTREKEHLSKHFLSVFLKAKKKSLSNVMLRKYEIVSNFFYVFFKFGSSILRGITGLSSSFSLEKNNK